MLVYPHMTDTNFNSYEKQKLGEMEGIFLIQLLQIGTEHAGATFCASVIQASQILLSTSRTLFPQVPLFFAADLSAVQTR